jgi:uncharacterized membrane protein
VTTEQWSAGLSLVAALVITIASFKKWETPTLDGGDPQKTWVRTMLVSVVVMLVVAVFLLAYGVLAHN